MGAIVCFLRCWPCQFDNHTEDPHSWMDSDDRDHAVGTGQISAELTFAQLAESHPCNCECQGRVASVVIP